MNYSGRSVALALIVSALAMPARSADTAAPGGDPGDELKQGFVSLGHGIRDGAVKAWGAVKSTFDGDRSGNSSEKKASAKKSSAASDQKSSDQK